MSTNNNFNKSINIDTRSSTPVYIDAYPYKLFQQLVTQAISNTYNGFNSYLGQIYNTFNSDTTTNNIDLFEQEKITENVLKRTTYYNVKNIYENISGFKRSKSQSDDLLIAQGNDPINIPKISFRNIADYDFYTDFTFDRGWCDEGFSADNKDEENKRYDFYQIFQVIDRGNNDIGTDVLANLAYLYNTIYTDFGDVGEEALQKLTGSSLYGLLSGIAMESGFLLQQIPNYFNINSAVAAAVDPNEIVSQLFGTHTDVDLLGDNIPDYGSEVRRGGGVPGLPGYIFQIGSITSETENDVNNGKYKNYLRNSFCLDVGYDDQDELTVNSSYAPDEITNSNITCFTIDFGRQNQQMFNNIQLDTSQFYDTEESLRVWTGLVNRTHTTNPNVSNLYPILERRSYTCTVSGLGNATIQPLTYFYLRNVPLFYGTYWITNVTHNITPNNMVTTFQGVRQSISGREDSRKALLYLLSKTSSALQNLQINEESTITEGTPTTVGDYCNVTDSELPYGEIAQQISTIEQYFYFNAQDIIGSYVYSLTNNNDDTDANKAVIYYLYNLSKGMNYSAQHSEILRNMVDVTIHIIKNVQNAADYQIQGRFSISEFLVKTSGYNKNSDSGVNIAALLDQLIDGVENTINLTEGKVLHNITFSNNFTTTAYTPSQRNRLPLNEILIQFKSTIPIKPNMKFITSEGLTLSQFFPIAEGTPIIVETTSGDIKYIGAVPLTDNTFIALFSKKNASNTFGMIDLSTIKNTVLIPCQKKRSELIPYTGGGVVLINGTWANPVDAMKITSGWSKSRFHPIDKEWRKHDGVDISGIECVTPIRSVMDGVVVQASNMKPNNGGKIRGYGHFICISHDGWSSGYAHLCADKVLVTVGQTVTAGEVIAHMGGAVGATYDTGKTGGTHLHFELRRGECENYYQYYALPSVDPAPYFNGVAISSGSENTNITRQPSLNAYYNINGEWLGTDGKMEDFAFICDGKKNGIYINARKISIPNTEVLDRATWVYGECSGSGDIPDNFIINKGDNSKIKNNYRVCDYYAFAIENIADSDGGFYHGVKERMSKEVNGKTTKTFEGYFEGVGVGGNPQSKKFAKARLTSMESLMKVNGAANAISSVLKSVNGDTDPTYGVRAWRGDEYAKQYLRGGARTDSVVQFTFSSQNEYYHTFFRNS